MNDENSEYYECTIKIKPNQTLEILPNFPEIVGVIQEAPFLEGTTTAIQLMTKRETRNRPINLFSLEKTTLNVTPSQEFAKDLKETKKSFPNKHNQNSFITDDNGKEVVVPISYKDKERTVQFNLKLNIYIDI